MALKKTASGKVDKRTTEYKEMVERAKKARLAAKKQKEKEENKQRYNLKNFTYENEYLIQRMTDVQKKTFGISLDKEVLRED